MDKRTTCVETFDAKPLTLHGTRVRLEPLELHHAPDLAQAGSSSAVWRYMPEAGFGGPDDASAWISRAHEDMAQGGRIAFAIIDRDADQAVGSTSYLDIQPCHRTLEIGWTWLAERCQRTHINTECKLLLLTHAFEELRAIRVQLKTDRDNDRSRRAIERIGAVLEGVHRNHMILPGGRIRDSAYYSITDSEWHSRVKDHVTELMNPDSAAGPRPDDTI